MGCTGVSCGDVEAAAPALVIATGGPSIPKMGATGFAYDLARKFGLAVVEPRPALVPLTLGEDDTQFKSLSGVSTDVIARCGAAEFREAALFTHRGLSGPAILQVSSYWTQGEEIGIDFLPAPGSAWLVEAKRSHPRSGVRSVLAHALPRASPKLWPSAWDLTASSRTVPIGYLKARSGGLPIGGFTPTARKVSPKPK